MLVEGDGVGIGFSAGGPSGVGGTGGAGMGLIDGVTAGGEGGGGAVGCTGLSVGFEGARACSFLISSASLSFCSDVAARRRFC